MTPTGFDSWKHYFSFAMAREYAAPQRQGQEPITPPHQPNSVERVGHSLAAVVISPLDAVLRGIRNPLVVVSTALVLIFLASIAFYPVQTWGLVTTVLPFVSKIQAHHIQAVCYGVSQVVILGLGVRTIGRLSNEALMRAYRAKEVVPVPIGAILRRA